MNAAVIYPNQLYENHPALENCMMVCIIEHPLFFGDRKYPLSFHKKKLVLHRASMKSYGEMLKRRKFDIKYFEYNELQSKDADRYIFSALKALGINEINYADTVDFILEKRIRSAARQEQLGLNKYENPNFLTDEAFFDQTFHGSKSYLMAKFYTAQRKRLNILIDKSGKPTGGKWSFDEENRKKLPKNISLPEIAGPPQDKFVKEAISYVNKNFSGNPGSAENFIYPTDHHQSLKWLEKFLEERFSQFGLYEDAIDADNSFLFHSVLTPALNSGLLSPQTIVSKTLDFAEDRNIPLNSLEGFLRQIIGWREFIRLVYLKEGVRQRTNNYWNFSRKMPDSFYDGTTGIEPVDIVIRRLLENSYCHHIERLMILGNFMLLCEIHPDEVYNWFMEMFIDSYDWVMVPNVYGMSQFADGGIMATKPYISSSNYVRKMSNFAKGDWCNIWDALFWRFIHKHYDFFGSNPRLGIMAKQLRDMEKTKLQNHLSIAETFLKNLK